MTDFKSELREILEDFHFGLEHHTIFTYTGAKAIENEARIADCDQKRNEVVDDIIALFISKGWVQTLKFNNRTILVNGKDPMGYVVYYPDEVMTGQEWYNKLDKELTKLEDEGHTCADCGSVVYQDYYPAMKRASGLADIKGEIE
jgi:hypothetical protein